jgi:hypothetical protein
VELCTEHPHAVVGLHSRDVHRASWCSCSPPQQR